MTQSRHHHDRHPTTTTPNTTVQWGVDHKYQPFVCVDLPDRTWPDQRIRRAPIWCSVDLRDGNQALIEPMNTERKLRIWDLLVSMGYREIEVGFPAASQTDYDFIRHIIDHDLIPADVTIQVLTQCRHHLIERTFEAIRGAPRVIIHIYNSTSPAQRQHVFGMDKDGIIQIASQSAQQVVDLAARTPAEQHLTFQYSPESFSQTELDFSVEICSRMLDIFGASEQRRAILNLPATVEIATPNHHADQIEWFIRHLPHRERAIISVHPHNDRGTAVAAAELALMAGAERIEGTLFGNGERTGNVDLITLGMNLFSQGVDPMINFQDIDRIARICEHCTNIAVGPRHPYAGSLVFTAFSGSHQDAIRKSLAAHEQRNEPRWDIPYLPIDPHDINRHYEEVIRINSQSGKGGVAFVMETDYGLTLPRPMQIDLAARVQTVADRDGVEIHASTIWSIFEDHFIKPETPLKLIRYLTREHGLQERSIEALLSIEGTEQTLTATGNGPIDAYFNAITPIITRIAPTLQLSLHDYSEHAVKPTSASMATEASGVKANATAAAYVTMHDQNRRAFHGVGLHANIVMASLFALTTAVNNALTHARTD